MKLSSVVGLHAHHLKFVTDNILFVHLHKRLYWSWTYVLIFSCLFLLLFVIVHLFLFSCSSFWGFGLFAGSKEEPQ